MTLDEAIIHAEEVAEENENVINTGTFEDGHTVAEMYCDDTECINAHLSRCAKCAEEHRQLAEWLKDYKRLLEKESDWIPVSERMPKYGEAVITVNSDDDYEINHIIDDDLNEWFYDGVIAWMPLSEPYSRRQNV